MDVEEVQRLTAFTFFSTMRLFKIVFFVLSENFSMSPKGPLHFLKHFGVRSFFRFFGHCGRKHFEALLILALRATPSYAVPGLLLDLKTRTFLGWQICFSFFDEFSVVLALLSNRFFCLAYRMRTLQAFVCYDKANCQHCGNCPSTKPGAWCKLDCAIGPLKGNQIKLYNPSAKLDFCEVYILGKSEYYLLTIRLNILELFSGCFYLKSIFVSPVLFNPYHFFFIQLFIPTNLIICPKI